MNIMKKSLLASAIGLSMLGFITQAQAAKEYPSSVEIRQMTQDAPSALTNVLTNGEVVISEFDTGNGYTGYVIDANGRTVIVYYDNEKEVAFSGVMLDKNGNNLSQQHYAQEIPKKEHSEVLSAIEETNNFFSEGSDNAEAEIYVIFDPACPHCHSFWENSRQFIEDGSLQIHWLPVAFLTEDSKGKVAAMWQSDSPVEALAVDMTEFRTGGINPVAEANISDEVDRIVQENAKFMGQLGSSGTPTIIYRTPQDKVYTIESSLPSNEIQELIDSLSTK